MEVYLIIALLIFCSIITAAWGMRIQQIQRQAVLMTMAANGDQAVSLREMQTAHPWVDRILLPLLSKLAGLGRMLTPKANFEQIEKNLAAAGIDSRLSLADFLGLRILSGLLASLFAFIITSASNSSPLSYWLVPATFLVGLYLPNFWLVSRVRENKRAIRNTLPDALDLMSICVDAGLGFEAAIQKVATRWTNALGIEFRHVLYEIQIGVPRIQALRHLSARTAVDEIRTFVAVLAQADQLGISIRDVLYTQSDQMRTQRRQRAEEAAQKAPLKMLFPMVLFILPALFIVILGPSVPGLLGVFR